MNTGFITVINDSNDLASCQLGFSEKTRLEGYTVVQNIEKDPDKGVIKQTNTITNTSDKAITVTLMALSVCSDIVISVFTRTLPFSS